MADQDLRHDSVPVYVGCCPTKKRIGVEMQNMEKNISQREEIKNLKARHESELQHAREKEAGLKEEVERLKNEITTLHKNIKEREEKAEAELRERLKAELDKDNYQKAGDIAAQVMRSTVGKLVPSWMTK